MDVMVEEVVVEEVEVAEVLQMRNSETQMTVQIALIYLHVKLLGPLVVEVVVVVGEVKVNHPLSFDHLQVLAVLDLQFEAGLLEH